MLEGAVVSEREATSMGLTEDERVEAVMMVALAIYKDGTKDWVTYFREVLGSSGVVRRMFRDEALTKFEQSEHYAELLLMLARLKSRRPGNEGDVVSEPQRMITVRLPASLLELLREEAQRRNTSINSLCIAKLVQVIEDDELVPPDARMTRKRRKSPETSKRSRGQATTERNEVDKEM